jgi:hypothetical protein
MKTQLQRPVSGKSRYTLEFKEEALAKWRQSGAGAKGSCVNSGYVRRFREEGRANTNQFKSAVSAVHT